MGKYEKNVIKFDWIGFTFRPTYDSFLLWEHFDFDNDPDALMQAFYRVFPEIRKCVYVAEHSDNISIRKSMHYEYTYVISDYFSISYDTTSGRMNKGVNVQIPSHGLDYFLSLFSDGDINHKPGFYDFLELLNDRCCNLSRLDLCYDDYSKTFRPSDYWKWWCDGVISSNFQYCNFVSNKSENKGNTVYFGKPRSDKFMRIYDKDIESMGKIDSVRYEFELHGRTVKQFHQAVLKDKEHFNFQNYLLSWFKVHDPDHLFNGHNKSASPLLPVWKQWLELEFSEVPTPFRVPTTTNTSLDTLIKWRQDCKYAIYVSLVAEGFSINEVSELLNIYPDELPKKYKFKLKKYFESI